MGQEVGRDRGWVHNRGAAKRRKLINLDTILLNTIRKIEHIRACDNNRTHESL